MMSPPFFQSHSMPTFHRFQVKSLEPVIWNLGSEFPTPPSVPTICVADFPCSMRNAPSDVPKPPVLKAGTGNSITLERLRENVVRRIQFRSARRGGEADTATS